MTGVEITLILVGILFVFVSFFVQEKLTPKDMEEITRLSEREMKIIVERQLSGADDKVADAIDEVAEVSMADARRAMEKESNEKIMAIDEYSNTVIESMNKTHNEILFLYNMLNDKHTELTGLASQLQQFYEQVQRMITTPAEPVKKQQPQPVAAEPVPAEELEAAQLDQELDEAVEPEAAKQQPQPLPKPKPKRPRGDAASFNEQVLSLHQSGISDVEIARRLGRGLGEVRLVIGLYKGEDVSEI